MHDIALDNELFLESFTDELLFPQIVTPLPLSVREKAGTELHLLCLLTGYPPIEIEWFLDDTQLSPLSDNRISLNNNKRELVIKNLNSYDCGSIMFRARNKYGEVTSSCLLQVESKILKKNNSNRKTKTSPSMKMKITKVFGKMGK